VALGSRANPKIIDAAAGWIASVVMQSRSLAITLHGAVAVAVNKHWTKLSLDLSKKNWLEISSAGSFGLSAKSQRDRLDGLLDFACLAIIRVT
jgi:hypothetical protein